MPRYGLLEAEFSTRIQRASIRVMLSASERRLNGFPAASNITYLRNHEVILSHQRSDGELNAPCSATPRARIGTSCRKG